MSGTSKRMPEFEVMRAISILLLLIHHSGFYSLDFLGIPLQGLSPYFEAFLLGCFFFISGYFTEVSLQKSGGNLTNFIASRFVKIYPPYLAAFGLYIFVLGISIKEKFDLLVYLGALQFVFSGVVKPIPTLWYVSAIILYYGIFLVLWRIASKSTTLVMTSVVVFILAYAFYFITGLTDERFFKYYFVFFTGMILARQGEVGIVLSLRYALVKSVAAVLGILTFSFALDADSASLLYISASYIFIVSMAVLLFTVVARFSIASPWGWVTGVSYASYFIYLFHRPFWRIIEEAIPVQGSQHQILFRMLPASLSVVVICYFLQRFYDILQGLVRR